MKPKRQGSALESPLSSGMDSGGKRIPRSEDDCGDTGRFRLIDLMMAAKALIVEF